MQNMLPYTRLLLCIVLARHVTSTTDDAYVIGLFPDPIYEAETPKQASIIGDQSLKVTVTNPGDVAEKIGFHSYLPANADMTSFSMQNQGTSYKAKKSSRKLAHEVLNKASTENHNAAIYIPKPLLDTYDEEIQTAENTVHIKAHNEMTFNLLYKESMADMALQGEKIRNRARISLDLYGIQVEDLQAQISSPNYPEKYPNNADTAWWIRVPDGKTVSIQLLDLDIEECCDRLVIYDGVSVHADVIAEVTGNLSSLNQPGQSIQSTKNNIFLRLASDCSQTSRGFKAVVRAIAPPSTTTKAPIPETSYTSPYYPTTNTTAATETCSDTTFVYVDPYSPSYITSPGYPNNYFNNMDCWWNVQTYSNYYIQLNVINMDLEQCCDKIYVYGSDNSSTLAVLSGYGNQTVISSGAVMNLNFVTDQSVAGRGFQLQFLAHRTPSCGSEDTQYLYVSPYDNKVLTSFGYPLTYYDNADCVWLIQSVYYGYVIEMNVIDMQLEGCCDYVYVYDGPSPSYPLIVRLSNGHYGQYYSTGIYMYINFRTDGSVQDQGFQLNYTATYRPSTTTAASEVTTSNDVCGDYIYLYSGSGYIYSPNYPNNYYSNSHCSWTIHGYYSYYVVRLSVNNLSLSYGDRLMIYDGSSSYSSLLADYDSSSSPSYTVYSTGKDMFIVFTSDYYYESRGFQLYYSATYPSTSATTETSDSEVTTSNDVCGDYIYLYSGSGYIYSPNYPNNYYSNSHCSWTIHEYYYYYVVRLTVNSLSLSYGDRLMIYDGSSNASSLLADYDSSSSPSYTVYSTGKDMFIVFTSDYYYESRGFQLYYSATYPSTSATTETADSEVTTSNDVCGDYIYLYSGSGYIYSPNYPNNYYSNSHCSWTIHGYYSYYVVRLSVNNLSLSYGDRLMIYDGSSSYSSLLADYDSGSSPSYTVYSTGKDMFIVFTSDYYYESRGFQLYYSATYPSTSATTETADSEVTTSNDVCGDYIYLYSGSGYIYSPNYPNNYYSNSHCSWTIHGYYSYYVVRLTVNSLSLSYGDRLMIYDGSSNASSLLANYNSGSSPSYTVYSTGKDMFIVFTSDYYYESRGFQLYYSATYPSTSATTETADSEVTTSNDVCGDYIYLYSGSGYIYSPNYPNNYYSNSHCSWTIHEYYSYYVVRLTVNDLSLSYGDQLMIYDGSSNASSLLANYYSGSSPSYAVYSTGKDMFIVFTSDYYYESRGFQLYYSATYPSPSAATTETSETDQTTNSNVSPSNCTKIHHITQTTGFITSSNYPYNYPNNLYECWYFYFSIPSGASHAHLSLEFDYFSTEYDQDVLNVYSDYYNNWYGPYSGSRGGNSYNYYTLGQPIIRFQTDQWNTYSGFNISYNQYWH